MNYLRKTFLWILLLPYALGFLGAASNQIVLIANHGTFPVEGSPVKVAGWAPDANGMMDAEHCLMTSETHLNLLADIFSFGSSVQSIGDLLIDADDFLKPYCWGIWLGLILTRKDPDGSEHELQTMQSSPRRFESMSMRLLRR